MHFDGCGLLEAGAVVSAVNKGKPSALVRTEGFVIAAIESDKRLV